MKRLLTLNKIPHWAAFCTITATIAEHIYHFLDFIASYRVVAEVWTAAKDTLQTARSITTILGFLVIGFTTLLIWDRIDARERKDEIKRLTKEVRDNQSNQSNPRDQKESD